MQHTIRAQHGFKTRYVWYIITTNVGFVIVIAYGAFGTAFAKVPQEYQWILGLLSPFAKDISTKLLLKVASKSAGPQGRDIIKIPVVHYITTKHAIFLAIIVGNVSTPLTTYCILFLDFAKTVYTALKIIRRKKNGEDVEGKHIFTKYI